MSNQEREKKAVEAFWAIPTEKEPASPHFYHDKKLVFLGIVYNTKIKKGDVVPEANFYCIQCNTLFSVVTGWELESDHQRVVELLKLSGYSTS